MLGLKGSTYEEKCAKLGLKTLEERRGEKRWEGHGTSPQVPNRTNRH
jgi:hypothetical protein